MFLVGNLITDIFVKTNYQMDSSYFSSNSSRPKRKDDTSFRNEKLIWAYLGIFHLCFLKLTLVESTHQFFKRDFFMDYFVIGKGRS